MIETACQTESNTQPLVSVIIPLFNREMYIGQCIESVIAQRYANLQLIVVDDGSSDNSTNVVEQYAPTTLLRHPNGENRGVSASINLGIAEAQGKYVAILDSDDYWRNGFLEITVKYMECHPDIGLVYVDGDAVSAEGEVLHHLFSADHTETQDPSRVLLDCYLLPGESLVRRETYARTGYFDESLRAAQDHDMCIRMAEITDFAYLPQRLFCYRQHSDSISTNSLHTRWTNGFKILQRAKRRYPYPASVVRKRRAVLHYRMGQVMFGDSAHLKGVYHWLKSLALDPLRALRVVFGIDKSY